MCMKTSDLPRKHIFCKERSGSTTCSPLREAVGVVPQAREWLQCWKQKKERLTPEPLRIVCVCVCVCICMYLCFKGKEPRRTETFLCKYSIHCKLLPLLCGIQFTYFWVQYSCYVFISWPKFILFHPIYKRGGWRSEAISPRSQKWPMANPGNHSIPLQSHPHNLQSTVYPMNMWR